MDKCPICKGTMQTLQHDQIIYGYNDTFVIPGPDIPVCLACKKSYSTTLLEDALLECAPDTMAAILGGPVTLEAIKATIGNLVGNGQMNQYTGDYILDIATRAKGQSISEW